MGKTLKSVIVPYGIEPIHALAVLSTNLFALPAYFIRELISNAIDAMENNCNINNQRIEVRLEKNLLSVRDYGKGMSEKDMKEILPIFFKSTKSKEDPHKIGSFGIGLYASLAYASRVEIFSCLGGNHRPTRAILGATNITFTSTDWEGFGTEVVVHFKEPVPEYLHDPMQMAKFIEDTFPFSPTNIYMNSLPIAGPCRFDCPWIKSSVDPNWTPFLHFDSSEKDPPEIIHYIQKNGESGGIALFLVREPLDQGLQGIRLFAKNVLVDRNYSPQQNHFLLTFLAGAINAHNIELTLGRDHVISEHPSVIKLDEFFFDSLTKGLVELASTSPSKFREFLRIHRSNLLEACVLNEVLCKSIYPYIPFRSHLGEWLPLQTAQEKGQAFYAFHSDELAGLTRKQDYPYPIYLFESPSEQAFFECLRSFSYIIWHQINEIHRPPAKGDLAFRAQQVKVMLESVYNGNNDSLLSNEEISLATGEDGRILKAIVVDVPNDLRIAWFGQEEKPGFDRKVEEKKVRKLLGDRGYSEASEIFRKQFHRDINEIMYRKVLYLNFDHLPVKKFFEILGSIEENDQRLATILLRTLLAIARNNSARDWPMYFSDYADNSLVLQALMISILDERIKDSTRKDD